MGDTERIRMFCQDVIARAERQVSEVGIAGAGAYLASAETCRALLTVVDGMPSVVSPERVPQAFREALIAYAHGEPPKHLVLRAMLEGDLFRAWGHAVYDAQSLTGPGDVLGSFVACVSNIRETLHPSVYGSPEAVSRWIERNRR